MIHSIRHPGAGFALLILAGCIAHPEPIVDTKGLDPEVFQRDLEECRAYAEQVSIAQASAKGAAVGAAVGAATGAISGDAGVGAGYGGIYGATTTGMSAEHEKHVVFTRCLEGRGYRVLNANVSAPRWPYGVAGPVGGTVFEYAGAL